MHEQRRDDGPAPTEYHERDRRVGECAGAWWTIVSPLLMTLLLLRVSGVTLLEQDIEGRRPSYRDYIRRTNAFIPGRPRA